MACQTTTIFAVASGAARSAVAVVRISGPDVQSTLMSLTGRMPQPRRATLMRLRDISCNEIIDEAIVLWFPAPASFTGEDCAELQVHGSRAIIAALSRYLAKQPGLRPAEAGEFTRRAFLNGRMDLTQVEGLADLIDAETEQQRRHGLVQLDGELGRKADVWRQDLMGALALTEAEIDFVEESDAPKEVIPQVKMMIAPIIANIQATLQTARSVERMRDGLLVVISGCPNVGKSTFLNAVAQRDVALVSKYAGTTRDALEIFLEIDGLPIKMVDTAGLQETENPVEQSGIAKALHYIEQADLVLWLQEPGMPGQIPENVNKSALVWRVQTKVDLQDSINLGCNYKISSESGEGIQTLLSDISELAQNRLVAGGCGILLRERHRAAFAETIASLARVCSDGDAHKIELAAEDLRLAARSLGRVTGRTGVEDVLDDIFLRFCIGK